MHTDKLETAAEAVKKVYNRALEIDGTSVSAVYDVIAVLQYMVKNKLKATKTLTTKQYHTIVNLVDMLEGWRDLKDYKAVQDATVLSKLMNQNFRDLQESSNTLKTTTDTQNTNGEAISEQLQELKHSVAAIQSVVEDLRTTGPQLAQNPHPLQQYPSSYAEAVNKPSPLADPRHTDVVARAKLANRRVIVKPTTDDARSKMNKNSEKDLVSEMNETLATAATTVGDTLHVVPDDIKVIGARKIMNSGIAYTFNSDEAAVWLQTPGALENIRKASGDETAASLQLNNVVVLFAPTTIDIRDIETWWGIESSSGLTAGTIRSVRFLKPAEHHHEGQ